MNDCCTDNDLCSIEYIYRIELDKVITHSRLQARAHVRILKLKIDVEIFVEVVLVFTN